VLAARPNRGIAADGTICLKFLLDGVQQLKSAAERFYERSHEANAQRNVGAPQPTVAETTAAMETVGHRYFPVMNHLKNHPGLEAVELGFGSPVMASAIAQYCSSLNIIDVADRREGLDLPANISFTKADLNDDFPLAGETFDVVIAMMVVEHLFDPFHSFHEIRRIARPGGRIFVNVPNIGSYRCRLQLLRGQLPITSSIDWFEKREWDGNHLHYFTVGQVERLGKLSGMKLQETNPVGNALALKRLRPSLFCHEISYEFVRLP
jgi:SAM-dependent methyltransferase